MKAVSFGILINTTMLQLNQVRIIAIKSGGSVLLATACFLAVMVSTAALPMQLSERTRLSSEHYLSDEQYTGKEEPKKIKLGRCRLHVWPKDEVWRLEEGDVMEMSVEAVKNCHEDITLTVKSKEGGKKTQVIKAGSLGTVWKSGRAHRSRQGEVLQVHLATFKYKISITKRLQVEFSPTIKVLTVLPYQGKHMLNYLLYLVVQRQRELFTGRSMSPLLGWDIGDSTSLKVKVEGNPKPKIVWRVKDKSIEPGQSLEAHYVALNETILTSTESVYELELRNVTLKMGLDGLKLIARNKYQQKVQSITVAVNMFPIASQRTFAKAINKSLGLVVLMALGVVVIYILHGLYTYGVRIAKEQGDGVIFHLVTFLIPFRTLSRVMHLMIGFCISVGLTSCFTIQGELLGLHRVMVSSLFIITFTCLYGRYTRIRAALSLILITLPNNIGIFLLLISTVKMTLHASQGGLKNVVEMSENAYCVSKIHAEIHRDSMMAYLRPVTKKDSNNAEVYLVKERDMAMAQESMKLNVDMALNEAIGEKLGEQQAAEKKNKKVDRQYDVTRFADQKKKRKGGLGERTQFKKKLVFKNINLCQDIGSNVLIQCTKQKEMVYRKCMDKFPGIMRHLGYLVCRLLGKAINCKYAYDNTVKTFKCDPPMDAAEIADGLLDLRDTPNMLNGDLNPQELHQMFKKPFNLQLASEKPREYKEVTMKRMEDVKAMMSILHIVLIFLIVLQTANKVIGDMIQYDSNINWENIYIGEYFRQIDRKRGRLGLPTMLPLKKSEKRIYVQSIFFTKSKPEEKEQRKSKHSFFVFIQVITVIFFLVEYVIYISAIEEIVGDDLIYSLTIDDYLQINSRGDSFFSLLINTVFEKFNVDNYVFKTYRVSKCNPEVQIPNLDLYATQQALLLFLFIINYVMPGPDRLKHVILRFYYPKRERKRQIRIYTNILLIRERFVELAFKQMIFNQAHGKLEPGTMQHDTQWQYLFLRQFRDFGFILRYFFQTTCSICKTKVSNKFVMCKGVACTMVYCQQCWRVLRRRCLSCNLVITQEMMEKFATDEQGLFDD